MLLRRERVIGHTYVAARSCDAVPSQCLSLWTRAGCLVAQALDTLHVGLDLHWKRSHRC